MFGRRSKPIDTAEQLERQARLRKLHLESSLLEFQLSSRARRLEWFKAIASIGGVIAALVGIAGLWISSRQWVKNQELSQRQKFEERLDHLLENLNAERPATRLAAIASLRVFLDNDISGQYAKPVLAALTNTVATDAERQVRHAALSLIADSVGRTTTPIRDAAMAIAIVANRNLVTDGKLFEQIDNFDMVADSSLAHVVDTASLIGILARAGTETRDFSRLYLAGANFSNAKLTGAKFSDTILWQARFDDAELEKSVFDNACLSNTIFFSAALRGASFRYARNDSMGCIHLQVRRELRMTPDQPIDQAVDVEVRGPQFACADLRDAVFTQQPLLGYGVGGNELRMIMSFENADLTNADLRNIMLVAMVGHKYDVSSPTPLPLPYHYSFISAFHNRTYLLVVTDKSSAMAATLPNFKSDERPTGFAGSNWPAARLDAPLRRVLQHLNLPSKPLDAWCSPRHLWTN